MKFVHFYFSFHSMAKLQQNESSIATVDKKLTVVAHEFHQLTASLKTMDFSYTLYSSSLKREG